MSEDRRGDADPIKNMTKELSNEVHWIPYATLCIQVILGIIGLFALYIYDGQLGQMRGQLREMRKASYLSCIEAQTARRTLLEIEGGEADSHNIAAGTITQAAAVTWAEAAQIKITQSTQKAIISPNSVISIPWDVENIGKSAAHNLKIVSVVKLVEAGSEPDFTYPRQPMNQDKLGNLFPNDPKPLLVFTTKPGQSPDSVIAVALTPLEYWRYEAGQIYVSDYGRGTYTDIFGKSHWIQFCDQVSSSLITQQLTRHKKCGAYNNSDSEPLEGKSAPPSSEQSPAEIVCTKPPDE